MERFSLRDKIIVATLFIVIGLITLGVHLITNK